MNFKSLAMPAVRAFARIKLRREHAVTARSTLFPPASSRLQPHLHAHWHVCPMSGQLQQRWSVDDSQEPPRRIFAHLMQQASLWFGARTFN